MLTDRFVRSAQPGLYSDARGLYLRVSDKGTRSWVLRVQAGGRESKMVLGRYPAMGLAEARETVERRLSGKASSILVSDAVDAYIRVNLEREYRKPAEAARMLERTIVRKFGSRVLDTVTQAELSGLLRGVVLGDKSLGCRKGSPVMANRMLVQLRRFLAYSKSQGWVAENALADVELKFVGGKETSRSRNLSWDEIDAFIAFLLDPNHGVTPGTRIALYLCLLTGQRAGAVLSFKETPGQPYLTGPDKTQPFKVPLTPHVRAALRIRDRFPAPSATSVLTQCLRVHKATHTSHDLRRTFATRLSDLGVAPHVVEKLLSHKMTGVMAVYNHSEYWPERVAAQKLWGRKLAEMRRAAKRSRREAG